MKMVTVTCAGPPSLVPFGSILHWSAVPSVVIVHSHCPSSRRLHTPKTTSAADTGKPAPLTDRFFPINVLIRTSVPFNVPVGMRIIMWYRPVLSATGLT